MGSIDWKSFIAGALFVYFLRWFMTMMASRKGAA